MLLPARGKQRSGYGNRRVALITVPAITAVAAFLTRQRIAWHAYPDNPIGLTLRQVRAGDVNGARILDLTRIS